MTTKQCNVSSPGAFVLALCVHYPGTSMGMIGVFEGLYNHALKNILFFGGASAITLQRMFPAPTYEMPNNLIFEVTGIMQGLLVIPMLIHVGKLFESFRK